MNASSEKPCSENQPLHSPSLVDRTAVTKRTISSDELLAGEKEVWILHGEAMYRLCETKSGKLILQK